MLMRIAVFGMLLTTGVACKAKDAPAPAAPAAVPAASRAGAVGDKELYATLADALDGAEDCGAGKCAIVVDQLACNGTPVVCTATNGEGTATTIEGAKAAKLAAALAGNAHATGAGLRCTRYMSQEPGDALDDRCEPIAACCCKSEGDAVHFDLMSEARCTGPDMGGTCVEPTECRH